MPKTGRQRRWALQLGISGLNQLTSGGTHTHMVYACVYVRTHPPQREGEGRERENII